jgi:hypothetical protein
MPLICFPQPLSEHAFILLTEKNVFKTYGDVAFFPHFCTCHIFLQNPNSYAGQSGLDITTNLSGIIAPLDGQWNSNPFSQQV